MVRLAYQAALFAVSAAEVFLGFVFLRYTVFDEEDLKGKNRIILIAAVIVLGWMLAANRKVAFFSRLVFVFITAISGIIACAVRKEENIFTFSLVWFYNSVLALLDLSVAFLGMEVFQERFMNTIYYRPGSAWQLVLYACSRLVMLLLVYLLHKKEWEINREYTKHFLIIDIVFTFVLMKYHKKIDAMVLGEITMEGLRGSFSLLVVCVVCVAFMFLVLKNQSIQKENEFLVLHHQMTEQSYQVLKEGSDATRHFVHDVKHHLLNLREYVKEGNLEKVEKYLDEIEDGYIEVSDKEWTGNAFLDFIINQKKGKAESKHIAFEIDSEFIPVWGFTDCEISSVFGNLLDNAIEASEKVDMPDRSIQIHMKKRGNVVAVRIINDIAGRPIWHKGNLVSDKKEQGVHGYGLKSVKQTVEKRDGYFVCHADDKKFWVDINLFCNDE